MVGDTWGPVHTRRKGEELGSDMGNMDSLGCLTLVQPVEAREGGLQTWENSKLPLGAWFLKGRSAYC